MVFFRKSTKRGLVSIAKSLPSGGRYSRMRVVKVPTPGPYSTNKRQRLQSTLASMASIVACEDGTTDATIAGCSMKPRRKIAADRRNRRNPPGAFGKAGGAGSRVDMGAPLGDLAARAMQGLPCETHPVAGPPPLSPLAFRASPA